MLAARAQVRSPVPALYCVRRGAKLKARLHRVGRGDVSRRLGSCRGFGGDESDDDDATTTTANESVVVPSSNSSSNSSDSVRRQYSSGSGLRLSQPRFLHLPVPRERRVF